jgi:type I restriction enzyme S subunit
MQIEPLISEVSIGFLENEGIFSDIQDGNHGEKHPKTTDYVENGVPFVMAKDLKDGHVDFSGCSFITAALANSLRIGFALPGDVLLTHKATMGRVAILPAKYPLVMLTPQVTYYRVARPDLLLPEFLKYAFLSPSFQQQLNASSDQSTRKYIGITAQRRLKITFPPFHMQRNIVDILAALDARIELLKKMNETLEAIARTIFKSWFVDFDPVRAKAEGREPEGMGAATAALFPSEFEVSELGLIPKGWRIGSILEIANLLSGGTPKTEHAEYWDGSINWAAAKDISQCRDSFLLRSEKRITDKGLAESSTKLIPALSTVVVARGATTGRLAMLGRVMAMNQTCYALSSSLDCPFSLYCLLRHVVHQLVHAAHGSVFDTVTTSTFARSRLPLPAPPLFRAYEVLIQDLFRRVLAGSQTSQTLTELRDTLLPRLISGKLRVPEAEKMAEAAV